MFDKSKCADCDSIACMMRCQWIEFKDKNDAKSEMTKMINGENSRVLSECVTCFACDEYCPNGSHPFDLITELQIGEAGEHLVCADLILKGMPTFQSAQGLPFDVVCHAEDVLRSPVPR